MTDLSKWLPQDEEIILRRLAYLGYMDGDADVSGLSERGLLAEPSEHDLAYGRLTLLSVGKWLVLRLGGSLPWATPEHLPEDNRRYCYWVNDAYEDKYPERITGAEWIMRSDR